MYIPTQYPVPCLCDCHEPNTELTENTESIAIPNITVQTKIKTKFPMNTSQKKTQTVFIHTVSPTLPKQRNTKSVTEVANCYHQYIPKNIAAELGRI